MKMLNTSEINRRVPVTCNDTRLPLVGGPGQEGNCRILAVGLLFPGCGVVDDCVVGGTSDLLGHRAQSTLSIREDAVVSG